MLGSAGLWSYAVAVQTVVQGKLEMEKYTLLDLQRENMSRSFVFHLIFNLPGLSASSLAGFSAIPNDFSTPLSEPLHTLGPGVSKPCVSTGWMSGLG